MGGKWNYKLMLDAYIILVVLVYTLTNENNVTCVR
jgi:hypothetical protein